MIMIKAVWCPSLRSSRICNMSDDRAFCMLSFLALNVVLRPLINIRRPCATLVHSRYVVHIGGVALGMSHALNVWMLVLFVFCFASAPFFRFPQKLFPQKLTTHTHLQTHLHIYIYTSSHSHIFTRTFSSLSHPLSLILTVSILFISPRLSVFCVAAP